MGKIKIRNKHFQEPEYCSNAIRTGMIKKLIIHLDGATCILMLYLKSQTPFSNWVCNGSATVLVPPRLVLRRHLYLIYSMLHQLGVAK